ncbi:Mycolic acid cyclopropane synthase [Corchorus olitorius]|uniref:Mycolic acid cyclopropane synthase n=1 Tax=Corchorus olitorius TaxID=93759 RepID=A0A1R3HZJ8_9ROSI|nr:Mycolic acid cyclopropane synthase [Corchorus olitorius]
MARYFVIKFLEQNISKGSIILKEKDGTVVTFKRSMEKCPLEVVLEVHNPDQFYWKLMTEADLGFADAFIHGDVSFQDKDEGLINYLLIIVANKKSSSSISLMNENRLWLASAKYLFKHILRRNTLTQARRNIARHYDLSNELFESFIDETMTYSCAVFKTEDEDLKVAQQRKLTALIEKARISKGHEVLELGCGWGSFAIEAVKRTGCKYTGITLSEEQLKYAEARAKKAGLQDNIKFLLLDYRKLPKTFKYDRIICCEMTEHVGNAYLEEFYRCVESILAEDGLFVLQFISITEELFHEVLATSEFLKEYIFPGGCLASLTRMLSAMAAGSRLSAEHVENIGTYNYAQTLRCWRKNFLQNKSKILALGFDENFLRTWEYYFCYCVVAFKSGMVKDYQVVSSRQGNFAALGDPYQGFPSAFSC